MKHKKTIQLTSAMLIVAVVFCMLYTRPQPLPDLFGLDPTLKEGFINASTWYPFTEHDRESQFQIDTCEPGSAKFDALTALLDNMSCRKSLTPNLWPDTVIGEAATNIAYCRGNVEISLSFNDKYLMAGTLGDPSRTLYIVDPKDSQILSDFVTEHGYNIQEYLDEQRATSKATTKEPEIASSEDNLLEPVSADILGQDLYDALQSDWTSYDALSTEQKILFSHIPGNCKQGFDTWQDCETFIGFPIFNPLEASTWVEKGTYVGMPDGFLDAPRIEASWYGTRDGHVEWISIQSGYRHEEIRIVVNAKLYGDPLVEKSADSGWSTELDRHWYFANADGDSPVITEDHTERYTAKTAYLAQGHVLYSIRVIGETSAQSEVQETLEQILPCFIRRSEHVTISS